MTGQAGTTKRILLYEPRESETLGTDLVKYLGNEGFIVERANSPEQAVEWAWNRWYRVFIFTFETARDKTALDEIQSYLNKFPLYIPKIIHADIQGFLYSDMINVQRNLQRIHTRVEFVPETEYHTLLECLLSFEQDDRLCFNDRLQLESVQYPDPLAVIMGMLERVDPVQGLSNKAEVDDLFRRTFIDCNAIEIEKELWHKRGRVAVLLRACYSSRPDDRYIAVLVRTPTQPHLRLVKPSDVPKVIRIVHSQASPHYSLTVYQLEGDPDWRKLRPIHEYLETQDWEVASLHLARVSDYIVGPWQRNHPRVSRHADLTPAIRALLNLEQPGEIIARFEKCLHWLEEHLPTREGIGLEWEGNRLHIQLPKIAIPFNDPLGLLQAFLKEAHPGQLVHVPAQIDPATVFVDADTGYVWLTELEGQGDRPRYWPEADLELYLRAAVADSLSLEILIEKELALNSQVVAQKASSESEATVAGLIINLHNSASLTTENQAKDYQVILAYKTLAAFCHIDLSVITVSNIRECFHHFIQLSLILQGFLDHRWIQRQALKNGFIEYNSDKDVFTVDGREIKFPDVQKRLLKYFIEHPFIFLSYETIGREAFGFSDEYIQSRFTNVREQIQQNKSRITHSLRGQSSARVYFENRKNGYFFLNPPHPNRRKTAKTKR